MPRAPRKRIAEGIYRNRSSYTGTVQVGKRPHALSREKAFALDTPLREIKDWRATTRLELLKDRPTIARGSIAAEVPHYLERCQKHPASLSAKKSEMAAWVQWLGEKRRHQVTPRDLDAVIAAWLEDDVAKKTVLNRCRTLHHFYVTMANDRKVRTPLDNIDIPRPEKRLPPRIDASTIVRTERRLRALIRQTQRDKTLSPKQRAQELDAARKARARFMVFAVSGIRPAQLQRLPREGAIDLRRRLVDITGGKGGEPILQAMNREQLVAWQAFVQADAFGSYDATKFRRRLYAAGWPKGVRPYGLKHTLGFELAEAGADHEDIKDWYGHTDTKTTRIYTGVSLKRIRRIASRIDNRFGWGSGPGRVPGPAGTARHKSSDSGRKSKVPKTA